jgi:hypothetical protein
LGKTADKAADFTGFEAELEKFVTDWSPKKIARTMAIYQRIIEMKKIR